jgi:membrane-associated phospholipid phosphatase
VKHLVQRARPVVAEPLVLIESYAFPSGHAAGSAAFYVCTAAWLLAHLRHRPRRLRWSVGVAAAAMVLWVSLSRLYLGVHYLSDVLAGMLLGSLWVLLWLAAARRFIRSES